MGNSTSYLAYSDCKRVMDEALESKNGLRITFAESRSAFRFLSRCNSYRRLDRIENEKVYEPAHSLHGRSFYDTLLISTEGRSVFLRKIPDEPDAQKELL